MDIMEDRISCLPDKRRTLFLLAARVPSYSRSTR